MKTIIQIKRIYDKPSSKDGFRVLVDRLWPRGIKKEVARIDLWAKEIAPSTELRKWLHEDIENRYKKFTEKYSSELRSNPSLKDLKNELRSRSMVTLLTSAKNPEKSHLPLIKKFLQK